MVVQIIGLSYWQTHWELMLLYCSGFRSLSFVIRGRHTLPFHDFYVHVCPLALSYDSGKKNPILIVAKLKITGALVVWLYLNIEGTSIPYGASTLLVLVLLLARLVLVNLRRHYFSCSPGFGAWGSVYLLVVCIASHTSTNNVDGLLDSCTSQTKICPLEWAPQILLKLFVIFLDVPRCHGYTGISDSQ
jgi:hypothetical protein